MLIKRAPHNVCSSSYFPIEYPTPKAFEDASVLSFVLTQWLMSSASTLWECVASMTRRQRTLTYRNVVLGTLAHRAFDFLARPHSEACVSRSKLFLPWRALTLAVAASWCFSQTSAPGFAQTTKTDNVPEVTELRHQGWSGLVLFPELAEDLGYLGPIKLKWVGNTISGPQDIQSVVTGDTDFGGAFNGSIAKLIVARAAIKAVIAYYGSDKDTYTGLYVQQDSPIQGPKDLLGKKIGVNTLAAYQEYVITDYLLRNGFSKDDVKKVTLVPAPPVNLAQLLRQGQIEATFLQDVVREKSVSQGGLREITSDVKEYGPLSLASYVLTNKFIEKNPRATKLFVEATARAIEWARTTPRDQVKARLKSIVEKRKRNEDPTIVDFWKSPQVAGKGGLISDKEFATYIDWYVQTGQLKKDQIKPSDVYTNAFNPYRETASK